MRALLERGFHYSEDITIIANGKSVFRPNLFIDQNVIEHRANKLREVDLVEVFNLLVNLYSNTIIHSNGKNDFSISLKIENEYLLIDFLTNTRLDDIYINYLLNSGVEKPSDGQGLTIIKESIRKLNYIKLYIRSDQNQNTITLKIN